MGTYICTLAPPDIPEESLSEFIDRLLIIANQGGMMKLTHTALLSRDIILLSPIFPDDDGCIDFFYNYFEEESWENAGYNPKARRLYSNKVGARTFSGVVRAMYVLQGLYSITPCIASINGHPFDASEERGWLNYLFHEHYAAPEAKSSLVPTAEFIRSTDDERAFWWREGGDVELSPEMRRWLKTLRKEYDNIISYPGPVPANYERILLDALTRAQQEYGAFFSPPRSRKFLPTLGTGMCSRLSCCSHTFWTAMRLKGNCSLTLNMSGTQVGAATTIISGPMPSSCFLPCWGTHYCGKRSSDFRQEVPMKNTIKVLGDINIPQEKQPECFARLMGLVSAGGMMTCDIEGPLVLLKPPEPDTEDFSVFFNYNYFDTQGFYEPAGFCVSRNQLMSGDVGSDAFMKVVGAMCQIMALYSSTPCQIMLDDKPLDIEGALNHLLEKYEFSLPCNYLGVAPDDCLLFWNERGGRLFPRYGQQTGCAM